MMKTLFNKLAKYALLRSIVYIALGVLMLIAPDAVVNTIVWLLAGYVILMGALYIFNYLRNRKLANMDFEFVSGILLVVLGVVIILFAKPIISVLPVFLGILLVLGGASSFVQATGGFQETGKKGIFLLVFSALIVVGGIIVIVNPFQSALVLFQIFGVFTVAMGINDLIAYFIFKKALHK